MEAKHTATPWSYEKLQDQCRYNIYPPNSTYALFQIGTDGVRSADEVRDLVETIVRACNAHDELVREVNRSLGWAEAHANDPTIAKHNREAFAAEAVRLRGLLAKAGAA